MRLIAVLMLLLVAPMQAEGRQSPVRRQASFAAGTSHGDGGTALALTAGMAVSISQRFGIGVDLAYARALDFTLDLCPPPLVCIRGGQLPVTGRTLALVPELVVDLLPPSRNLRAYVLAGAGLGHVRQRYFDDPLFAGERIEHTRSNLTPAFSFGGGIEVPATPRLGLGVDVRVLHLLDDEAPLDRFITPDGALGTVRVGARMSWRF